MAARRKAEQELSKDRILDAARDIFIQKGYQQASMRQIAQELGFSHGAIYYHFKNKAELFYALVRQDFLLLDQKLQSVLVDPNLDNRGKLVNLLLGYIEFGLTHQSHYEIMFMIKDEDVKVYLEQQPNESYNKFSQAIFQLTEKNITLPKIWSIFLSLHGFVAHYWKSGQTFEDVRMMAALHVEFILKGIGVS